MNATSPHIQAEPTTLVPDLRGIFQGAVALFVVLVYSVLPDSLLLLFPVYIGLTILGRRFPRFPVYYILTILTLVKFFQVPDFEIYKAHTGSWYRWADPTWALLKFADELALIVCLQELAIRTRFFTRMPEVLRALRIGKYFWGLILLVLFSGFVNAVPSDNIIYFFTNWFRPFIILATMLAVPWSHRDLRRFVLYLISLAFIFQLGGSFFSNYDKALQGMFFWIDDFTGTFVFPLSEWAAFLLSFSLYMFISEFAISKKLRYLFLAGAAVFGIISAQAGTMTLVLAIAFAGFFLLVLLTPRRFGLPSFQARGALLLGLLSVALVLAVIWTGDDDLSWRTYTLRYAEIQFRKWVLDVVSISDIPKILAYLNLGSAVLGGEINPIWGAGPAMYLTGTGQSLNISPLLQKYSTAAVYGSEGIGQAESQVISYVGLMGELGVAGLLLYLGLLTKPFRYLWTQRHTFFGTPWHGTFIGTMGVFVFLLLYAGIQTPLDSWVQVPYLASFAGALLIVSRLEKDRYTP